MCGSLPDVPLIVRLPPRPMLGQAEWGNPGTFGSSRIWVRIFLRCSLKSLILIFERFRIFLGRALKSLWPAHWKLESLKVLALAGPLSFLAILQYMHIKLLKYLSM
jgi:hypothetical protein